MIADTTKRAASCREHHAGAPSPSITPDVTFSERKSQWRRQMTQRLCRVSPSEWQAAGSRIAATLETIEAWRRAHRIAVYMNTVSEVPTALPIEACRQRQCEIYLPIYDRCRRHYVPAAWHANDPLHRGAYGMLEPVTPRWAPAVALDVILAPGRAFTRTGTRLGRGGGHYDRFLAAPWAAGAVTIGLALECQLVDDDLADTHDIGMDWVVTEKEIYAGRSASAVTSRRTDRCRPNMNARNRDHLVSPGKEQNK